MRISTDVLQTIDANGVDVSSAWLWVDNDTYDSSYRQVLTQPISLESITLDFCRWKVDTVTLIIRATNSETSDVLFAGEAALIADEQAAPPTPAQIIYTSTGVIGAIPTITDNGDGTVTVGSSSVALRADPILYDNINLYNVSGATFTIPSDSATYYICAKFNLGTVSYYLEPLKGNINATTITPVYACWNILGVISSQYFGTNGDLLANKIDYAQTDTVPYRRSISGGLIISENNLVWSVTSALVYAGTTPLSLSAITASTTNLIRAVHNNGVWTYSAGSATYGTTYYDDGVNLIPIGANKYAVRWIFRSISNPAQIYYCAGVGQYADFASADTEIIRSDLPETISKHCILIGKAVIQNGATSGVTTSTFSQDFSNGAMSSTHNSLGGLYGDSPFYHLSQPAYTEINNITALSGTGLLKLTSGTPSIDSTSYWYAGNHPTALTNYGISSSDTLFDAKYQPLENQRLSTSNTPTFTSLILQDAFGAVTFQQFVNVNGGSAQGNVWATYGSTAGTPGPTNYGLLLAHDGTFTTINGKEYAALEVLGNTIFAAYSDHAFSNVQLTTPKLIITDGTSSQFLKADGSLDSNEYITNASSISGNAATATKLATARTIALSGDGSWSVSFNGSDNVTGALTLTSLLTAGSAGSSTSVPVLAWDAKGRLTSVENATISIPHSQISDWGTYINQPLLTTSSPTFASATIANGVYRVYTNDATVGAIYGSSLVPSGQNYTLAWNQNGSGSYLNGITSSNLFVNNIAVLSATATGITAYQPITGSLIGTASLATKLAAERTIGMSGDVTGAATAFDGTKNITIPTTLPTLLTAGSAGSATAVPTLTWDAKGRLTAVGSAAITTSAIGALPSMSQTGAVDFNSINSSTPGAYAIFGTTSYTHAPAGLIANAGGGMLWQGYGANNAEWNAQVFVDAQQDALWYRTEGAPATWRSWHLLLTSTSSIPHTQISDWASAVSNVYLPLAGGTMSGNLLGGTSYNIGATSNWWGSIYATTIYESNVALSSKYLGINASISHAQISDWGTYINQALLTTSSPTFANATIHGAQYTVNSGNANFAAIYGSAPDISHLAYTWALDGSYNYINASNTVYLDINGVDLITLTSTAFAVTPASTFTGLITANGGISGDLTGTASNASALGGVNSDYFVQGTGYDANSVFGRRTTSFNYNGGTATSTSLTDPLKSGFYDGEFKAGQTPNNSWAFVINTAHSNQQSNSKFQFQLAASFGNQHDTVDWGAENYWVRVINNNGVGDWRTLIHSDNYPSFNNFTSGLSTTTLTASGLITANGGIAGNLTGHASLDIPLTGSSAITGSLVPLNTSSLWLGGPSKTWAYGYIDNLTVTKVTSGSGSSGNCSVSLGGTGQYGMYLSSLSLHIASAGNIIADTALSCSGALRVKYQEKSADYTVTDRDCGTIIAMTGTGLIMTIQAGSNYTAGFSVDISGPGGGSIASYIRFTDAWFLNGTSHAANTNLGLQSETASIRYVTGMWYVSLP